MLGVCAVGLIAAGAWGPASHAAVPNAVVPNFLTQQGRLLDSSGNPVTAPVQFLFTIYDMPTLGTALWTETQTITLDNGYFAARLGDKTALPATLFDGNPRYLGVKISTDAEMTPRQPILSVPYAIRAETASKAADQLLATLTTLQQKVAALEAKAVLTTITGATVAAGDDFYNECNTTKNAQFCNILANRHCAKAGFTAGWFVGETADGGAHYSVNCIK
jgi:hypothetical protein